MSNPISNPRSNEARQAPTGFLSTIKQLGPGMILSGGIVGSGELIATTTLGARVGFAALWLILVSCVIKVAVQEHLGRHTVLTGETTFQALDRVPGPRWRVSWVVWCWIIMFMGVTFQQGGIIGGVGQVFHLAWPQLSVAAWTIVVAVVTAVLLTRGGYGFVEASSTVMVVSFTIITVAGALLLAWTPYAVGMNDLVDGLRFQLPAGGLAVAFAVFGITGVGATELIYYPYWCLEKGYARFVGRDDGTAAWRERARGWLRVMRIDVLMALLVYTLATVAFYLLGASVLFGMGKVPAGYDMIETLSNIYTMTLGPWGYNVFLVGAFFALYSTVFSANASNSRVLVDFLDLVGFLKIRSAEQRWFHVRVAVVVLLSIYTMWYLLVGEPVMMVLVGGTAQACMLPIIGFSTIYLRYTHGDPKARGGLWTAVALWVSSTAMLAFAMYTLVSRLRSL